MGLGSPRTCFRKFFENVDAVMAILVHFEQFLWQFLFNSFAPNFEFFTKYDTFSINACLRRKDYYQRSSKLWKNCGVERYRVTVTRYFFSTVIDNVNIF